MNLFKISIGLILICSSLWAGEANHRENYSQVSLNLNSYVKDFFMQHGIPLEDNQSIEENRFEGALSNRDLSIMRSNNIQFEVLIENLSSYYANRAMVEPVKKRMAPFSSPVPIHFKLGSMAGFLNYDEMMKELDSMSILFPNLISQRMLLDTGKTYEGRQLYYLKMSDNHALKENEPEVLFTALHHSREPLSLQQLIYFMWYLLENYDNDSEIKYLLDNAEIYFVPCINPDGYHYVSTSEPNGGSLWRKNRRKTGDTTYGVDLNRNYDMAWGVSGSSSDPSSDVYHGASPFSEPETQILKRFAERQKFLIAMNHHSFGHLLFYPYGYALNTYTPQHDVFLEFAGIMTAENGFFAATVTDQVASGLSDDWFYESHGIFSYTPESGPEAEGFWPPINNIIPHAQNTLQMNLSAVKLALRPKITLVDGNDYQDEIPFDVEFMAPNLPSDVEIKFSSLDVELIVYNQTETYSFDSSTKFIPDSLDLALVLGTSNKTEVRVQLDVTYGPFTYLDTIPISLNSSSLENNNSNWESNFQVTRHSNKIQINYSLSEKVGFAEFKIITLAGDVIQTHHLSSQYSSQTLSIGDLSGAIYLLHFSENCSGPSCRTFTQVLPIFK